MKLDESRIKENDIPVEENKPVKRKLHFFYILDRSGSMTGLKIAKLNQAVRETIPEIIAASNENPNAEVMIRVITFSDTAEWHVGPDPIPISKFKWDDINTSGSTSTSKAIRLLNTELDIEKMTKQGIPPVCILVSDGQCTDSAGEYERSIQELLDIPWGKKAIRLAIAMGIDADIEELKKFVSAENVGVLTARNPEALIQYIIWLSTIAVKSSVSSKISDVNDEENVHLPNPPEEITPVSALNVW